MSSKKNSGGRPFGSIPVGTSKKRIEGKYRIERFSVIKNSNKSGVEIGFYSNLSQYQSASRLNLTLNRLLGKRLAILKDLGVYDIFHVNDIPDTLGENNFIKITVQFTYDKLGPNLIDPAYDLIEDSILECVEELKMIVLNK